MDEERLERLSRQQTEELQQGKDEAQRRSIGRRLQEARKAQGLSQGALGERLGVTCQELVREQYPGAPLDPEARREWMKARSDAFASRRSKPEGE
jgi:DNA-binding XRE family transcriptional regulator